MINLTSMPLVLTFVYVQAYSFFDELLTAEGLTFSGEHFLCIG
jgi:hypothetical protein